MYKPPSKRTKRNAVQRAYEALEYLFEDTEDESSDTYDAEDESPDSEDTDSSNSSQNSEPVIEDNGYPDDDDYFFENPFHFEESDLELSGIEDEFGDQSDLSEDNYSSSSSDDESETKSFRSKLEKWAGSSDTIFFKDVDSLLKICRTEPWGVDFPRTARGLMHISSRAVPVENVAEGTFYYFGILNQVVSVLERIQTDLIPLRIELSINIDGVSLARSGPSQFWPILACICNIPIRKVFPIAIYHGISKPSSVDEYLDRFVDEAISMKTESFLKEHASLSVYGTLFVMHRQELLFWPSKAIQDFLVVPNVLLKVIT